MELFNDYKFSKIDLGRGLKLPNRMSSDLSELIGIHFGDGNMDNRYNNTYRILYACNIAESSYARHILSLFNRLFNIRLKLNVYPNKSYIALTLYSKTLCQYFNQVLGIPYGPKNDLHIPKIILQNPLFLSSFIRGVFDTDGCFTVQKDCGYIYQLVKITNKNKDFVFELSKALASLGIPSFVCKKSGRQFEGYDVVVRNNHVSKFLNIIGSNNHKNIKKNGDAEI